LGTLNSSRNEIEKFYNFWYKFKSWREFSYLDEEDVSKATNREEKRWLEKKNKNERARRKKEENQRILKLVDTAFKLDPRVKLFKEMERKDKEAARQTKLRAAREGKLKAVRGIPDCKPSGVGVPKKAMVERRENQKALDTARKKQRENFLNKVKSVKFFCAPEVDFKQHINNMQRITKFAETVAAEKLEELIKDFNEMDIMLAVSEAENTKQNSPDASEPSPSGKYKRQCSLIKAETAANRQGATHVWTSKELELLFKALKKFPSGSLNRWKNIQDFITTRCEGSTLQEKDIERSKAFYQEG
jgi:DnaJ family protein C protein 2